MVSQDPNKNRQDDESLAQKLKQSIESLKKNEKVGEFCNYAQTNTRDTIASILLATGLLLTLIGGSWFGYTLIGVIVGLYFGQEIYTFVSHYNAFRHDKGSVRNWIFLGGVLAIFIAVPFMFFGVAIAVAFRQFFVSEK